tara:strand:+ start:451 stop:1389 length:939 start_codon:yes stop_codon:yes gene_type:complete
MTPIHHLEGVMEILSSIGNIKYDPYIEKEELKSLLSQQGIEYIFTNPNKQTFILDEEVLANSSVRVINTASTGLNHIDLDYCENNNIEVWSLTKDYELINDLPSTSELAFALMMALLRKLPTGFEHVKNGGWDYEPFMGRQIKGKTIGIIGYGRLGKIMCKLFDGWGVETLVYDPYVQTKNNNYKNVDKQVLLEKCDVIFLHVHVNDETRNMVDEQFLSLMKKGSYLVNTSRGELVDENAIIDSISSNHLAGYATDVITDEFSDYKNSALVQFSKNNNVIITPHVGGMTWEGQQKAYKWAVSKFKKERQNGY